MNKRIMKKSFIIILLLYVIFTGYIFFQWQYNYIGTISVYVPKGAEVIIEGDFLYIKTIDSFRVPLEYGRYAIRIPEYNVECMIHKNNRGNAVIEVVGVNEFDVKCNSNAWIVE